MNPAGGLVNRFVVALALGALVVPAVALAQSPDKFSPVKCRETDATTVLAFAEKGDPEAMFCMAIKYRNRQQVDDVQATRWFLNGAEAGHPGSMFHAGVAVWSGRGIAQDKVEGYKWLDLSVKLSSIDKRPYAVHGPLTAQDGLTRVLSPQQIAEAKKRAADWEKAFQTRKK
jgi:hypothetical protein